MEKSSLQRDLEDWELLGDGDEFFDLGRSDHAPEELIPAIKNKEEQDDQEEELVKEIKEVITHVSFRKLGESEFVDMKLDSPTSRGGKLPLMEAPRLPEEEEEEEEMEKKKSIVQPVKNSWKIGALCSIGVAAATVFIFVLSGPPRQRPRQKMQFRIFTDEQMAARLNQAMSAARGVPMTRAHISFGGYYDGL
ncbi:uncharacterized protein LOC144701980 isoform X2 [Wolffia australiana]